jgi:hypothetical protein
MADPCIHASREAAARRDGMSHQGENSAAKMMQPAQPNCAEKREER